MTTTCNDCVVHHAHWFPEMTWWVGIGAALYLIIWWRVLWGRPQWANGAGVLALPVAILGFLPAVSWFSLDASLDDGFLGFLPILIPSVVMSVLGVAPLWVGNRRYWKWKREQTALAEQARADKAEQWLRKLGA